MWFKQVQLFQLTNSKRFTLEDIKEKLESLAFIPCLPSMPYSMGWISPIGEESEMLVRLINDNIMLCLQIEEKILPAAVIRHELSELIKQIETSENRQLRQKEKYALKDEILISLLPRAFSKFLKVYAYIDSKNNWLVLGTANAKITEKFISMFKKSIVEDVHPTDIKKLSHTMTHWLKNQSYPSSLSIEKTCVLQDPNQENRIIRCQQQDLFAGGIQSLIKDGCEVVQLALFWHDRISFVLNNDFSLRNIQYQDEITSQAKEMKPETKQQEFDADFLIMATTLSSLLEELLSLLNETTASSADVKKIENVIPIAKVQ